MSETENTIAMPTNTYELKQLLNSLSKEVFGASSRWAKLVNKGYPKLVTETVTELVPNEADPEAEGTTREVQVPVKVNGMNQTKIERHTVESVFKLMLEMKAKRDAFFAELKRQQEAQAAKEAQEKLQKQVNEELMGSAVV